MNELFKRERERGFEAEDAEGRAVEFYVVERWLMRGVSGGDGISGAVSQASEKGFAVFTRGERRIHFEAGIVLDILVDEREVVGGNFAGYAETPLLGPADLFEGSFRGEMSDVEPRAGKFGKLNVARNANGFRGGRHALQAEARGGDPFAHDGAGGERNIFGVFHDGKIERAAVIHNLAGEFRGGNGLAIVGDSDDAGLLHGGNFGDVLACAANGSGADGPDANAGARFGAIENKAGDGRVVVDGVGVWHATDSGEAAASRRACAGFDGF